AKDSVAAHDKNVGIANSIAANPDNLDQIDAEAAHAPAAEAPTAPPSRVTLDLNASSSASSVVVARPAATPAAPSPMRAESAAPAVTVAVPGSDAPVEPSMDFRAWVSTLKISGVRGGEEARAFVDGRLV